MGTAGIQKALVTGLETVTTYGSSVIVELKGEVKNFTAYIDHSCLGRNTKNPENTINSVKWFLVREHIWTQFRELHSELSKESFFDVLKNELRPSDYQIFEGSKLEVKKEMLIGNSPVGNLGVIFMLMPYSNYPEIEIKNIFITALEKPQVLYAQFHFPKGGYIPLENNEKKAAYGQTIDVEIYTHLLPDWRNRVETFDCKVELLNRGKVMATSESNIIENRGNFHYNNRKTAKFLLDIEWQKQHQNKGGNEEFYIRLSGYESSKGSVFKDPDIPLAEGSYDSQIATDDWTTLENGKWVYHISRVLFVPFDTFADLMGNFEIEKNNQIQYIGDIPYTAREFDPCGYSKIKIKDESDENRAEFIVFDEEATIIDRTTSTFALATGENRKNISINIENYRTSNDSCQGLFLADGEKHTDIENIFKVNKVFSTLKNGENNYVTNEDPTLDGDTDVERDTEKSPSRDVSEVQRWTNGVDYRIESKEKVTLMLNYIYNKTLTISNNEFNPNFVGTLFEDAWLFNYLKLNYDDNKQLYYLPVSSCRYPNQIARINILPDIKWTLLFKLNFKEEDFQEFKEEHDYQLQSFIVNSSETTLVNSGAGVSLNRRTSTVAGVSSSRTTTLSQVKKKGGVKKLIEILKKIEVSLTAEWKDEAGEKKEKDVIEGFLEQIYGFFNKISDISKLVGSLVEGDSNEEDKEKKAQLEEEMKNISGGRSLDGAWEVLTKKS